MPQRFIFRQVDYRDVSRFIADGAIRAKNYAPAQLCHQASYGEIVDRRNSNVYTMPCGGVVNDYVPFYFSPLTSFTYTIAQGNVTVRAPDGTALGNSNEDDRIFFVGHPERIHAAGLTYCFSDIALNANAPIPTLEQNLDRLEHHVNWAVFDDPPLKAAINELSYPGVCRYFKDAAVQGRMNRSKQRMAEFLVHHEVPLSVLDCIVVKTDNMKHTLQPLINAARLALPIYVKRDCYWT
ncbi:DarT ssDNA thymidine ADP-ribosyltransferase family protein [Paracoccus fontiphilus]|uniref:DarT ssDNA thymidine ADP-ribosyltransferase family protein n=1 Tax=Paracoccus fontiphilus TaxID=1815556 RepID=A0ABV7IKV4_9RHOB|nr:DarT ssDNA thymidine ADP-ribosyltransferase family protein [Paracoccus fontiphilus]